MQVKRRRPSHHGWPIFEIVETDASAGEQIVGYQAHGETTIFSKLSELEAWIDQRLEQGHVPPRVVRI